MSNDELDQTLDDTAFDISDADIEEFTATGRVGDPPSFHPILQVWREVLKPAEDEKGEPVLPEFAHKITSSYREVNFADMNEYRDRYFDKIIDLASVLDAEIDTDDQCLTYATPAEDLEHNSQHYKQVITDWQLEILRWEKEWDCTDPNAGVELAAISEVQKMFFGGTGLAAYLDSIQFQFTEADKAELVATLQEFKDRKDGNE